MNWWEVVGLMALALLVPTVVTLGFIVAALWQGRKGKR